MDIMQGIIIIVRFIRYMKIGPRQFDLLIFGLRPLKLGFTNCQINLKLTEYTIIMSFQWIHFVIVKAIDLSILISAIFL